MVYRLFIFYGYIGLFAISLISSIIPIPTEPVVFGLLDIGANLELIFITLITGSIIGSCLGYLVGKYELKKLILFHNKEKEIYIQMQFKKYGAIFLVFSPWIPFIGDLAPLVAGIENYGFRKFIIVISAAKIIKSIWIVYFSIKVVDWLKLL